MASSEKLQRIVDAMIELDAMWIRGSIGVLMTDAFYTGNRPITADYLAERMRFSDDSARRWLDSLAERGVVILSGEKGRKMYQATENFAERTMKIIDAVPHI